MTQDELVERLIAAGLHNDLALADETLVLWEHDEDPPAPLTRPEA